MYLFHLFACVQAPIQVFRILLINHASRHLFRVIVTIWNTRWNKGSFWFCFWLQIDLQWGGINLNLIWLFSHLVTKKKRFHKHLVCHFGQKPDYFSNTVRRVSLLQSVLLSHSCLFSWPTNPLSPGCVEEPGNTRVQFLLCLAKASSVSETKRQEPGVAFQSTPRITATVEFSFPSLPLPRARWPTFLVTCLCKRQCSKSNQEKKGRSRKLHKFCSACIQCHSVAFTLVRVIATAVRLM